MATTPESAPIGALVCALCLLRFKDDPGRGVRRARAMRAVTILGGTAACAEHVPHAAMLMNLTPAYDRDGNLLVQGDFI